MKKTFQIFSLLLIAVIVSCKKDYSTMSTDQQKSIIQTTVKSESDTAKKHFAYILSKAINDEPELRSFIKREAMKMIDNDYDVFYPFVKDKEIKPGTTFRDELIKYANDIDQFQKIEEALPLLTIYVPKLPSGFSADSWKESENPNICSNFYENGVVDLIKNGKVTQSLKRNEIPGLPTLVIKENERIRLKDKSNVLLAPKQANTSKNRAINHIPEPYIFIDSTFDNSDGQNNSKSSSTKLLSNAKSEQSKLMTLKSSNKFSYTTGASDCEGCNHMIFFDQGEIDTTLRNSYKVMGVDNENWQRDYIYYSLTPNANSKGAFRLSLKETIRSIRFTEAAISRIMDQDDPRNPGQFVSSWSTPKWTEGNFEFKIDVLINNTSGLGTTITRYLSLDPDQIFYPQYSQVAPNAWIFNKYYLNKINVNIPLISWDLESNGSAWKFLISEVDDQQTETRTESSSTEFATNFGFDVSFAKVVKLGPKFGASLKTTKTSNYSIVTTLNSDDLGTLELFFSDPVFRRQPGGRNIDGPVDAYDMYSIKNGYIEMVVMPKYSY
ncbi:hypothetical protein ACN1CD_01325 [Pedobacter sp. N23S346]